MNAPTRARTLADWVAAFRLGPDVPESRAVSDFVLDLLGVALAGGHRETSAHIALADAKEMAGRPDATLFLPATPRVPSESAAFAHGVAAHSIEMDDVHNGSSLHPGAVVIPAALAVAEERGRTGRDFLEAVAAGYEIALRVGEAAHPTRVYRQGFHPTAVCGIFGAAAAAGRLMGLDADGLVHAFGIAWSMAAGNMSWQTEGSLTKRLQVGNASRCGVHAARLAARGATGPAHVFEPHGFFHGYGGATELDGLTAGLGGRLKLHEVGIKPYACCRYNQAPVDGLLALRRQHKLRPNDVEAVDIAIASTGHPLVALPIEKKRRPGNQVEAQFSLPYSAAVALCAGAAGPDEYLEPWLTDAGVLELAGRVRVTSDPEIDAKFPGKWSVKIRIAARDGRSLEYSSDDCLGDPEMPLGAQRLADKFRALTKGALRPDAVEGVIARLRGIGDEARAGDVTRAVAGALV